METGGIPLFDCIVIGLGAHGSAVCASLARSGQKVLGIERQSISPHRCGSSHGQSRIIRLAYFEDPTYVSLLKRSLDLWKDLSHNASTPLLHLTGGLMMGKPESTVIRGTLASIRAHNLPHDVLTAGDIRAKYASVFAPDDDEIGLFEETAGYLVPELCIQAFLAAATDHRATLCYGEAVCSWGRQSTGCHYEVRTTAGGGKKNTYIAKKIVLAAGAWTPQLIAPSSGIMPPLHVVRRVQYWYRPSERQHDALLSRIPIYIWDKTDGGSFYGFPLQAGTGGVKVALHQLPDPSSQICYPDSIDRMVCDEEKDDMRKLLQQYVPFLGDAELVETETCMYTMTPDEHFLIDFLPDYPRDVVVVSACSGHGFKFSTVIGEIVCDLITKGHTEHDISLFSIERHRSSS